MARSKYPKLVDSNQQESSTFLALQRSGEPISDVDLRPYFESRVDHDGGPEVGVWVFKSSPESMTLQIRTHGPVGQSARGATRAVFSRFTSNRQNMLKLAEEIRRIALELPEA